MACCLMAPCHYLNQCWLIIKSVLWHSPETNFTKSAHKLNPKYVFQDNTFKITSTCSRGQWVKFGAYLMVASSWHILWCVRRHTVGRHWMVRACYAGGYGRYGWWPWDRWACCRSSCGRWSHAVIPYIDAWRLRGEMISKLIDGLVHSISTGDTTVLWLHKQWFMRKHTAATQDDLLEFLLGLKEPLWCWNRNILDNYIYINHCCWCLGSLAAMSSSATVLNIQDDYVLFFHEEGFQLSMPTWCYEKIENRNLLLIFSE